MLCYRCGSHVPDTSESCGSCGQKLAGGGVRQATATFSRRKLNQNVIEGAPYGPDAVVANRYRIRDALGAGPLGFVFRAHDKEVDVEVALKVVNPRLLQTADERRQFAKAIRVGRKLSHPHVARIYEDGEDQDRPFYTAQLLEGLTLRKIIDLRLAKGQFFSLKEIEPILAQLCSALEGIHKVCAHSDLKPENVIVLPDLLKVTDVGLGQAIPRLPFVQALKTRKADRYLAPEFVEGTEIDLRADIYSLGVIVGEMLSGLTPDGAIPELLKRNPELPSAIEGLYRKALNSNPLARFKSAQELFDEFADIARRVAPPPIKRVEPASAPPAMRPRPPGPAPAALQLRPLRSVEKPPPPVPDESLSEESELPIVDNGELESIPPDGTQPMASSRNPSVLEPTGRPSPAQREETEVIHSDPALFEPTRTRRAPKSRAVLWLLLLTASGLVTGSAGGYWLLQHMRKRQPIDAQLPEKPMAERRSDENARADRPAEAERLAAEKTVAEKVAVATASAEKASAERLAAESAAAEKAAAEKAAAGKVGPEKVAAESASGEKATLTKVKDDKLEKGAAERIATGKVGTEKDRLSAERAAIERAGADPAAAEKLAAEKIEEKAGDDTKLAAAKLTPLAEPTCPEGMRLVPAGAFRMGTPKDDPMMGFDERILASVEVGAFCIDVFEYPNKRGAMPLVNVSWHDAKRLCESRGKRLCTEAEWEKACKGPNNARFPYGSTFDPNACNTEDETGEDRTLAPSGRFGRCRSGYGVADLSGNVAEWTASPYGANEDKAQKGGAYDRPDYAARCSARKSGAPSAKSPEVGFRCCADVK